MQITQFLKTKSPSYKHKMRNWNNRGLVAAIIIVVLLAVIGVLLFFNFQGRSIPTGGIIQEEEGAEKILTPEEKEYAKSVIEQITPYWARDSGDCSYYEEVYPGALKSGAKARLSFALDIDGSEETKLPLEATLSCSTQVNANPVQEITLSQEVRTLENAYLDDGSVFQTQTIEICCGLGNSKTECVTKQLRALC
jgi:hypothetical protein